MTLKEAIKILIKDEFIADNIYDVRARAIEEEPKYSGNSWDHPRVKRYAQAVATLKIWLENEETNND